MADYIQSAYGGACRKDIPYPSVSHESVPSLIDNLVTALYGNITKSVVNRQVIWNIPCDPNNTASIPTIPRQTGEGLLCYIIRVLEQAVSPTLSNAKNILGGASGNLVYQVADTTTSFVPSGTSGQILFSNGTSAPSWGSASSLSVASAITSTTATNLAGGGQGYLPYQNAQNSTRFLSPGAQGQILTMGAGNTLVWTTNSNSPTLGIVYALIFG